MIKNKKLLLIPIMVIMLMIASGCAISSTQDASPELVSEENVTITTAGTYAFSGTLSDPITVNASEDDDVEIILDGVTIESDNDSPIYVVEAKNVTITLAEDSVNTIIDDRDTEQNVEDFPNAAIYSMADLKIIGEDGAILNVEGNLNDGIVSKDDLEFKDAMITIIAADDGIRGKDSVDISGGKITIEAGGDGIKSDNEEDEGSGVIALDGDIEIAAGDDAVHGVTLVEVKGGTLLVTASYEGLEASSVTISGGTVDITSQDDALNVADIAASDTTEMGGTRGPGGMNAVYEDGLITISGGTTHLNSSGDGFDSNGNAVMTGGTLIVSGPTNNGNGAIDVNGTFEISGGTLIAVGSSGMAESPSTSSDQYAIQVNFDTSYAAGTLISLTDASGNEVFTFTPEKTFQSIVYSSPELESGETYTIALDGSKYATLTLDDVVTKSGESMRGGMRMR